MQNKQRIQEMTSPIRATDGEFTVRCVMVMNQCNELSLCPFTRILGTSHYGMYLPARSKQTLRQVLR